MSELVWYKYKGKKVKLSKRINGKHHYFMGEIKDVHPDYLVIRTTKGDYRSFTYKNLLLLDVFSTSKQKALEVFS